MNVCHFVTLTKLLTFAFLFMNLYEDKVIDESRQGEALLMEETSGGKKMFLESYGCAMNFSDSEIVASILSSKGYSTTTDFHKADLILINTCAIRDGAEQRVRGRLKEYNIAKKKNQVGK